MEQGCRDPLMPGAALIEQILVQPHDGAALVKTRLKRMQYRPGLLGGFLAGTGLDLTLFCDLRS